MTVHCRLAGVVDLGIISSGSTTFLTGNSCLICQKVALSKSSTIRSPCGCLPGRIFLSWEGGAAITYVLPLALICHFAVLANLLISK